MIIFNINRLGNGKGKKIHGHRLELVSNDVTLTKLGKASLFKPTKDELKSGIQITMSRIVLHLIGKYS